MLPLSEAYSEPNQTSEIELFSQKTFILDIWFLNKPQIVSIDCNMYYCKKITLKVY